MSVEADAPAGESFAVLLQAADGRIIAVATLPSRPMRAAMAFP